VSGACLAFRRQLLDAIGPLDERFFLYFEETDFCLRVRSDAGLQVWFEPAARVRHEGGASTRQCGDEAEIHYARSASAFLRKHHGPQAARRLAAIIRVWLALHLAVHRLEAAAGDPRARDAIARKRRLRQLHRSLEAGEARWGWAG
jgi:GT2 family glycosyltransferase